MRITFPRDEDMMPVLGALARIVRASARLVRVTAVIGIVNLPRLPRWLALRFRGREREALVCLGEAIAETAERLGPVYLKLAQMISHRTDLLSEDLLLPLRRIQDRVRPETFAQSRQTLERALGQDLSEVFPIFETEPLAAGSIATVYQAVRADGSKVAVKVVRQDVSRILSADLSIGANIMTLVSGLPALKGTPVQECYAEVEKLFTAQLDMRQEAFNLDVIRSDSFIRRHVEVPRPHHDLVRRDVLVMDFIDGAISFSSPRISEAVYRRASLSMLQVLYRMVFDLGAVHCDMHPGNLLLDRDDRAWLIDGGFFASLEDGDRVCFRDTFLGLAYGESDRLANSLVRSAMAVPVGLDNVALRKDVVKLIETHHGRSAGSFLVVEFVQDLFRLQQRHRLYARSNLVAAIWAFVTFEGLVRGRLPDLDFQGEARPFIVSEIISSMRVR